MTVVYRAVVLPYTTVVYGKTVVIYSISIKTEDYTLQKIKKNKTL